MCGKDYKTSFSMSALKPFRTLRDFGVSHLGHYETCVYGHRLGPFGPFSDFFLGQYKTFC